MTFVPWEQTNKRGFTPKCSIRSNGHIGFNLGAVNRFKLSESPYIKLFYDEANHKIGIKTKVNKADAGALHLNVKGINAYVSAKAFLDNYEIDYSSTMTGDLTLEQTEDFGTLLVLNLEHMKKRKSRSDESATRQISGGG